MSGLSEPLPMASPHHPPVRVHLYHAARFLENDSGREALIAGGCVLVDDAAHADWVVLGNADDIERFAGQVPRILVLTHEPRYAIDQAHRQVLRGTEIVTHQISSGHFPAFWHAYIGLGRFELVDPATPRSGTALFATKHAHLINAHPADLLGVRAALAEYGVTHGLLDLYGKGWGRLETQGETRAGQDGRDWPEIKHEQLGAYAFNVALENTYLPNYVSEKFWQAVRAGCMPIYLGSTWMDRLVDPALYVDLRNYADVAEVFAALEAMDDADRIARVRALQLRLAALEAEANPHVWATWVREGVELIRDLDVEKRFPETPWGRDNRSQVSRNLGGRLAADRDAGASFLARVKRRLARASGS